MSNICVIGTGYVGLTTGTSFADLGNNVVCVDVDTGKIERLNRGEMPIYEPGLEEMVKRNRDANRLHFSTSYADSVPTADFVFIAVGTPQGEDGGTDMRYVESATISIAKHLADNTIIVNKSTMPIGTGDWVTSTINEHLNGQANQVIFAVVSNPEFLAEGSAIQDFLTPDRVVLGSTNREAAAKVAELYKPLKAPIIITDLRSAEMIKYASNAMLATRVSFVNEMSQICEAWGADVKVVAEGMGYDKRIGPGFLKAGIGYGGSCFPKDVKALAHMAAKANCHPQLLLAVMDINTDSRRTFVQKIERTLGSVSNRKLGIWGLAFKPNTDDMREAPALDIVAALVRKGATIKAFDPIAMKVAKGLLPGAVEYCEDPYQVAEDVDGLLLLTEWNEFKHVDFERVRNSMAHPYLFDGRNLYDPHEMTRLGFIYRSVGRPTLD